LDSDGVVSPLGVSLRHLSLVGSLVGLLFIAPLCHADLIGTTVTGVISGVPFSANFWDPVSGDVPGTGFQNSPSNQDSPTVVIVGGNEFGELPGGPDVSFSASGFTLTENLSDQFVAFGQFGITFTDAAFQNVNLVGNSFPGLTYAISGDVISISIPLTLVPPYDYSASFSVNTPEPSGLGVVLFAGVGLLLAHRSLVRRTAKG
jgi:hypothetical protein